MPAEDPRITIDSHLRFPWRERSAAAERRACAWPCCTAEATHRAPRSRDELRQFIWFCLEHVREYNRQWDFFAGMSPDEIDRHRRADTTWHRPSWRFGTGPEGGPDCWNDPFGFFAEDGAVPRRPPPASRADRMREVLGLRGSFTLEELKARYTALVKRFHPDLRGGDRANEDRLKRVIEAYRYLRDNELYVRG
jgi:hypothetical protein